MARPEAGRLTFLFLTLAFSACSQAPRVSVMVTDIPEMAIYAEVYNAGQNTHRILAEFQSQPGDLLSDPHPKGDLVVGYLKFPPDFQEKLSPMEYIFDRSGSSRESFYPGALEMGRANGIQYMIPLSFNLPLIMGLSDSFPGEWPGLMVEMDDIITHSATLNRPQKNPPALGFSLRWSIHQIESLLFRHRKGSLLLQDGTLNWENLDPGPVLDMLGRHRKLNGEGFEDRFTSKYLPGQGYKLLTDRRLVFYPTDLRDFLSLPLSQTTGMSVRYPSLEGKVTASGSPVMLALPRKSSSREAAEDFAAWLLRAEVQHRLLDQTADLQLKTFGLAGGLSTLTAVTEDWMAQGSSGVSVPIPPGSGIRFPPSLPQSWEGFHRDVMVPWIQSRLESRDTRPLGESYSRWLQEINVDSSGKAL